MKIALERDVLADAVQWAARALPSRPSAPILSGLLLKAQGDTLSLSSFDYDTSAQTSVPATISDEGEALVSGKLLADIARSLPSKSVQLTANDQQVELVCGSSRFILQTMPVSEYPALPAMPQHTGNVSGSDFARAVSQVSIAAGKEELLPVFTGVRVEISGEKLSLMATDRYRMTLKELIWKPENPGIEAVALVPARTLSETAKSLTSEEVTISLASGSAGDGLIGFSGGNINGERKTTTRLLEGDFSKVRSVMNIQALVNVRIPMIELTAAVKRVALVADRNTPLRMVIGSDAVILEAATGDQAQASESVEAVITTSGDEVLTAAGFNPRYLLDALSVIDAPYVNFGFTQSGKPCLMTSLDELDGQPRDDYRHVIMLVRLPGTN